MWRESYMWGVIAKYFSLGAVAIVAASGCAGFVPSGEVANAAGHTKVQEPKWAAVANEADTPAECTNQPYAFTASDELRHTRNDVFVRGMGDARAHARDALVKKGSDATVEAKFSYGKFAKDLEDEDITLHVRGLDCKWSKVGTVATDDRGIATFKVPGKLLTKAGRYAFEAVLADGESAPGAIYVVDGTTKAVVFDVDETLTTGNDELIEQLIVNDEPEMRKDASKIVNEWAKAGWFVAYVTGRPHQFTHLTRKWLKANGFPEGLLRTSESLTVSLPGDATQLYKEGVLKNLKSTGLDVQYAYGNSTSDICAYSNTAIDPKNTFILGPHAGKGCPGAPKTNALVAYTDQLGAPILALVGGVDTDTVAAAEAKPADGTLIQ